MGFNSINFVVFFAVLFFSYYALPLRFRRSYLLIASAYCYSFAGVRNLLLILFSIAVNFIAAGQIERSNKSTKRIILIVGICFNVLVLATFKYANFFFDIVTTTSAYYGYPFAGLRWDFILPAGISFHTFQHISYLVDVYRGKHKAEQEPLNFALFVLFFPQLVAGPIERSTTLLPQILREHRFDYSQVTKGLKLLTWGYFKKLVVADRLAEIIAPIFVDPENYSATAQTIATYLYCFQLYCDFSGYIDIARGAAAMLGFNLSVNFRRPYAAQSIADFWRRWHITLGSWIRDYLYLPLGGFAVSKTRWVGNMFLVFFLSGLWHGASWNFIAWGLLHASYIVATSLLVDSLRSLRSVERLILRIPAQIRVSASILVTFHLVAFAWIYFRTPTMVEANFMARHFFAGIYQLFLHPVNEIQYFVRAANVTPEALLVPIAGIVAVQLIEWIAEEKISWEHFQSYPLLWRWALYQTLVLAVIFGAAYTTPEFIYFRF